MSRTYYPEIRGEKTLIDLKDQIEHIQKVLDKGGSFCFSCSLEFDTVVEARKHDVEKHYEYALAQCYGNKQLLMDSIKEMDGLPKMELSYNDSLPCPHCLQPTILSDSSSNPNKPETFKRATHYKCVNETCFCSCWMSVTSYHSEIKLIKKRLKDGYDYSNKVIKFINSMLEDKS
jgi:hypothetical protein